MSRRAKGSVRIGPISLFSLIILLSLAVMAVLAITTAQATNASAEKQALFTSDSYENEVAAQEFVASVDTELAAVKNDGGTRSEALGRLGSILPEAATIDGDSIHAEFSQASGRTLKVSLMITNSLSCQITEWKTVTNVDNREEQPELWNPENG